MLYLFVLFMFSLFKKNGLIKKVTDTPRLGWGYLQFVNII